MRPRYVACLAALLLCLAPLVRAQSPDPAAEDGPSDTPPLRPAVEAEPPPPAPPSAAPHAEGAPMATASAAAEPAWYEDISLNALVSAAVLHNFNTPDFLAGANVGRLFDRDNDSFKLDVASVALEMEADAPGKAGFRLDIAHGQVVPAAIGGSDLALQQAYVSYVAPWGSGLRFDVGTFFSRIGAEVIENYANVNDTYSRSLLFGATPPELTGARIGYNFAEVVDLKLMAVNGWRPNVIDNNGAKTLGLQFALTPDPVFTLQVHYLAGAELTNNHADWRHLVDAVATFRLAPVTLLLEGQYGHELVANWGGALATVRWEVVGGLTVAARAEYFDDTDRFRNLGARLVEFTLVPSYRLTDNAMVRLEYRHDHQISARTTPIFNSKGPINKRLSQDTLAANFVFVF